MGTREGWRWLKGLAEGGGQREGGEQEEYACRGGLTSARHEQKGKNRQQFQEKQSSVVSTEYTENEISLCPL